jgi:RNA polymerase sigma-70 factor (ECF subfamily)
MLRSRAPEVGSAKPEVDFEPFFREHYRRLFQAMYLLTSDAAEAEDLTQESFVRVFERWDRVARMERRDGYVFRTAMNLYRSRLRRARRWSRGRMADRVEQDHAAAVETRLEILRALEGLPARQREALVLVDWLGLSADEAGRLLRIQQVSVRSLLHRGRSALKRTLGGEHD